MRLKEIQILALTIYTVLSKPITRQLIEASGDNNNNSSIWIGIVMVVGLVVFVLYDRRNGYRCVNFIRHQIGELVIRIKNYRKNKAQKQYKIETEECLPTAKRAYSSENQQEKTFIETDVNNNLQQTFIQQNIENMMMGEQIESDRQEVDLKGIFQKKESNSKNPKAKKTQKSKSKLKDRLKTNVEEQQKRQYPEQQQNTSIHEDTSFDNPSTNATPNESNDKSVQQ